MAMIIIFVILFGLSILGYFIEHYSLGDKRRIEKSMVEEIEEERPN